MEDNMLPRPAWISVVGGFLSSKLRKILILSPAMLGVLLEAHAQPMPDGEGSVSSDLEAGILFSDAVDLVRETPEAENDPLACALLAAEKVEDISSRTGLLVEIAARYIESGKFEQAADVLQEAEESAGRIADDWEYRQSLLVRIAEGYARARREDRAFAVVEEISDAEFKADALARISVWQEKAGSRDEAALTLSRAAQTAKSQQGEFTRIRTLTDIVKMLFRAGLNEQAFTVALQVEDDYIRDLILEELAVDFADERDHESAKQVADVIVHPMSRAVALKALAMDLAKSGRSGKAADALSQSMAAAQTIQDEGDRVKLIVDVAGNFGKLGFKGKALAILSQILKLARDTRDSDKKVNLLVTAAGSYAQAGSTARAMKLLEDAMALAETRVNDDFHDMIFSKIAFQYVRMNHYGRAMEVTAKIEDDVVLESTKVQMAYELIRNGAYTHAFSVAAEIKDHSTKDQIRATMAVKMAEAGSFEQGYAAAGSMEGGLDKLDALVCIAGIFAQKGEEFNAMEMLRDAFDEALALPESAEKAHLLARIAAGYLEARQMDEFMSATRAMSLFDKAWVLTEISEWYDEEKAVGRADASMNFLHEIIQGLE